MESHRDTVCPLSSAASYMCVPSLVETLPPGNPTYSLSHSQMCNAEQVLAQARKRKRRTSIETNVKGTLESFFRKCVKPSPQEISQIAEDLNLDKDVGWGGRMGAQMVPAPEPLPVSYFGSE